MENIEPAYGIQHIACILQKQSERSERVEKYPCRHCQIEPFYRCCLKVRCDAIAGSIQRLCVDLLSVELVVLPLLSFSTHHLIA